MIPKTANRYDSLRRFSSIASQEYNLLIDLVSPTATFLARSMRLSEVFSPGVVVLAA